MNKLFYIASATGILGIGITGYAASTAADAIATTKPAKPRTVVIKYEPEKEKIYKLIPLGVMDFESVEKTCRPWLSTGGLLVNEESRNSVLVYDTPAVVGRIVDFMREADRTAANIMVSFECQESSSENSLKLGGAKPADKSALVAPLFKSAQQERLAAQFIVTRSGLPASIWVSDTDVDPVWLEFARKPLPATKVLKDGKTVAVVKPLPAKTPWLGVNASLQVRPIYRADGRIDLEIYPEIRYLEGREKGRHVKMIQLAARITVTEGQKVFIGSFFEQKKYQYTSLFGPAFFKRKDIFKIGNMYVSAQRAPDNTRFFSGGGQKPLSAPPGKSLPSLLGTK